MGHVVAILGYLGLPGAILGPSWAIWGLLRAILGHPGAILGLSWDHPCLFLSTWKAIKRCKTQCFMHLAENSRSEVISGLPFTIMGHLWRSWCQPEAILGPSCGQFGAILDHFGTIPGPSWAMLWPSWAILSSLGPSWGHPGPLGAFCGPFWAILGPSWG